MRPVITATSRVTGHVGFGPTCASTFIHLFYVMWLFNSLGHVTIGRITSTSSPHDGAAIHVGPPHDHHGAPNHTAPPDCDRLSLVLSEQARLSRRPIGRDWNRCADDGGADGNSKQTQLPHICIQVEDNNLLYLSPACGGFDFRQLLPPSKRVTGCSPPNRPRRRRAAEQRDEIAPLQGQSSSA
jgi:hypothetical protein